MSNKQLETKKLKIIITFIAPKNEILGCKSNKTCTRSVCRNLQNADERNRKRPKYLK